MKFFDDIVSAIVVAVVTVLFLAQTAASWPTPFELRKFHVERHNPFAVLYSKSGDQRVAAVND